MTPVAGNSAQEDFKSEMEELCSAEDFLDWFGIAYQQKIVEVNRLHILQRFHNYLAQKTDQEDQAFDDYKDCLERAYNDFTGSSAQQQKVLKVFQKPAPSFVSFNDFE